VYNPGRFLLPIAYFVVPYLKEISAIPLSETDLQNIASGQTRQFSMWRTVIVFLGALILSWPAFLNRFPLIFPDSLTYIGDGRIIARRIFLREMSEYYGMRSRLYSLGIYPFHWNTVLWPVAALQALIAAYVIWLVVRSIVPRQTILWYLVLCAALSLFTSLSWYSGLILPDILGPVFYLCVYLIVFARESLSRTERALLVVIMWWTVASHGSHLLVAAGLCSLLILLLIFHWKIMERRWRAVATVIVILLITAATQIGLNDFLTGKPSLNGDWPPVLTARILVDGPGREYLETHCPDAKFLLCEDVHHLPVTADDFLWSDNGIWGSASDEKKAQLHREEMRFVIATVRTYPLEQLKKSAANFGNELITLGLDDLAPNDWVLGEFDIAMPGQKPNYQHSLQIRDALPLGFFSSVQKWTVIASLVVIAGFIPYVWRRRPARILGLGVIIVSAVVMNALVTGILSGVETRYQSRVIWLLSLLAGMLLLDWRCRRSLGRSDAE
jgi:hypothetical protein